MGHFQSTLVVCPTNHVGECCSLQAPCTSKWHDMPLETGTFSWLPDTCTSQKLTVRLEVRGIAVQAGCLIFSEEGAFINYVDATGSTPDLEDAILPLGTDGSFSLVPDAIPEEVNYLFFVAMVQPGTSFVESPRCRCHILDPTGESLASFEKSSLGDGNAMVMFALLRAHHPKWRCEAVGRVYHLYPGTVPMRALGRHLERLASMTSQEHGLKSVAQQAKLLSPSSSPRCNFFSEGDLAQDALQQIVDQDAFYETTGHPTKRHRTAAGLTPSFQKVDITFLTQSV